MELRNKGPVWLTFKDDAVNCSAVKPSKIQAIQLARDSCRMVISRVSPTRGKPHCATTTTRMYDATRSSRRRWLRAILLEMGFSVPRTLRA